MTASDEREYVETWMPWSSTFDYLDTWRRIADAFRPILPLMTSSATEPLEAQ